MLGRGTYELREAARYADVPLSTVRAWFPSHGDNSRSRALFRSDYEPVDDQFAISFLNLIEVYVAGLLRRNGVSSKVLRRTYQVLQGELQSSHPFALETLRTDGHRILRRFTDERSSRSQRNALSTRSGSSQWISCFGQIEYNQTSSLACRLNVAEGIVIDPEVAFGKPVVRGTGVTTFVLANQYTANSRDAVLVADLYRVSENDVLNAVKFEHRPTSLSIAA